MTRCESPYPAPNSKLQKTCAGETEPETPRVVGFRLVVLEAGFVEGPRFSGFGFQVQVSIESVERLKAHVLPLGRFFSEMAFLGLSLEVSGLSTECRLKP